MIVPGHRIKNRNGEFDVQSEFVRIAHLDTSTSTTPLVMFAQEVCAFLNAVRQVG
jgi:hypothetical protein